MAELHLARRQELEQVGALVQDSIARALRVTLFYVVSNLSADVFVAHEAVGHFFRRHHAAQYSARKVHLGALDLELAAGDTLLLVGKKGAAAAVEELQLQD